MDGADRLCLQEAYDSVVEYFGENPKTTSPSMFFTLFSRFIKAYKVCFWQASWDHCRVLQPFRVGSGAGAACDRGQDRRGRPQLMETNLGPSES